MCIYSVQTDNAGPNEILDVMHVHLVNTDLFAGARHSKLEGKTNFVYIRSGN